MSLISQLDRQMAIEALEFYIEELKRRDCTSAAIMSFSNLRNWIELEYEKNETP